MQKQTNTLDIDKLDVMPKLALGYITIKQQSDSIDCSRFLQMDVLKTNTMLYDLMRAGYLNRMEVGGTMIYAPSESVDKQSIYDIFKSAFSELTRKYEVNSHGSTQPV